MKSGVGGVVWQVLGNSIFMTDTPVLKPNAIAKLRSTSRKILCGVLFLTTCCGSRDDSQSGIMNIYNRVITNLTSKEMQINVWRFLVSYALKAFSHSNQIVYLISFELLSNLIVIRL